MNSTKKRSYPKKKATAPYKKRATKKSITSKYSAKKKTREVKTVDIQFSDTYTSPYVEETFTGITFNTTPMIQNLVTVNQGAGIPNRIGNKIALKSLRIRGTIVPASSGGGSVQNQIMRYMIVYDRQPNGQYPAVNNVLSDILVTNAIVSGDYLSSINPSFYDRFIVLCDKIQVLGGESSFTFITGPTEQKGYVIDEFIKLKGLETVFTTSSEGSPVGDINTGALYLIALGNITEDSEPAYMTSKMRLRFYDN